jgi:hypothetical protein
MAELLRAALTALVVALSFFAAGACLGATTPVIKAGSDWVHLTSAQRDVLAPFEEDWNSFTEVAKLKWIGIADRYPKMSPPEQANVRTRMEEWSKLTPQERQKAREQYKKLRTTPPAERRELEKKWREYQALSVEQKQALKLAPKAPAAPSASAPSGLNQGARPPKPVVVAPRTLKPTHKSLLAPPAQSAPISQSDPAKTPQ